MALAIESGATASSVIYIPKNNNDEETRLSLGPGNFRLMSGKQLSDFFEEIKSGLNEPKVYELGVGMAGILNDTDKMMVEEVVRKIWPELKNVWIGSDTDTALACLNVNSPVKVIVIAGTGSNCVGFDGKTHSKIGGYGHMLGDRGSSYAISYKALRMALRELEQTIGLSNSSSQNDASGLSLNTIPSNLLIASILKSLGIETISQLVSWSTQASKTQVAGLTFSIIQEWKKGNHLAKQAVEESLIELSEDCVCLIDKFVKNDKERNSRITIGLTGSLFTKNEEFAQTFMNLVLAKVDSSLKVDLIVLHETVQGALQSIGCALQETNQKKILTNENPSETEEELANTILPIYLGLPQTECRNQKSMKLDTMSTVEAIDLMISEEIGIYDAIMKQKESIKTLIEKVSHAFQNGGRLFYVGAGTSGRLGILDASECPPTFRSDPNMVQGIIAGGFSSVSKAKEGAEDSIIDGMNAINERKVCSKDVVVGIAASGRTPFVWGAMHQAKNLGAFTAFLTFNIRLSMKIKPDLVLAMDLGPEILTGSTRLKSGSATKCILNMLSTLAMVKIGKCFENLMVDLNPANQKLKQRALRIVLLMTNNIPHVTEKIAQEVLLTNKYDIKKTVVELRQHLLVPQ